jgi:hypothetical protein
MLFLSQLKQVYKVKPELQTNSSSLVPRWQQERMTTWCLSMNRPVAMGSIRELCVAQAMSFRVPLKLNGVFLYHNQPIQKTLHGYCSMILKNIAWVLPDDFNSLTQKIIPQMPKASSCTAPA